MANQMWIAGGTSPNPSGRPKNINSVRTVKGMIERFVKKNITPNKMQVMYDCLKENQKLEMLMQLLPYVLAKPQADTLTTHEIDELYSKLEQTVKDASAKKAV